MKFLKKIFKNREKLKENLKKNCNFCFRTFMLEKNFKRIWDKCKKKKIESKRYVRSKISEENLLKIEKNWKEIWKKYGVFLFFFFFFFFLRKIWKFEKIWKKWKENLNGCVRSKISKNNFLNWEKLKGNLTKNWKKFLFSHLFRLSNVSEFDKNAKKIKKNKRIRKEWKFGRNFFFLMEKN